MRKARVMHLVRPAEGGMRQVVQQLVLGLDKDLFEIYVACPETGGLWQQLQGTDVHLVSVPLRGEISPHHDLVCIWRLARVLRQQKIELLHVHGARAGLVGRLAAVFAGTPAVIYTVHNSIFLDYYPGWKKKSAVWLERLLVRRTDLVVTVSEYLRRELQEWEGLAPEVVKTIYNGIPLNISVQNNERSGKEKVVGTVARLATQKGVTYFLKAAYLLKDRPEVSFMIVGDGPLRETLQKEALELGLEDRVHFTGYRRDVPELLNSMNIFVLPSISEGLALVAIESMAHSLPVVASRVGGIPEVVLDGVTGFLVPPENPEKLAEAVKRLLDNPEMAETFGKAGRKRVEQVFTLESMVEHYQQAYQNILQKKFQH